ncbi:MAG: hypothetical protein H7336_16680 [Bacteriovorax sp.]|nr:hypothetical protein [Bacteriovorax sp.]
MNEDIPSGTLSKDVTSVTAIYIHSYARETSPGGLHNKHQDSPATLHL